MSVKVESFPAPSLSYNTAVSTNIQVFPYIYYYHRPKRKKKKYDSIKTLSWLILCFPWLALPLQCPNLVPSVAELVHPMKIRTRVFDLDTSSSYHHQTLSPAGFFCTVEAGMTYLIPGRPFLKEALEPPLSIETGCSVLDPNLLWSRGERQTLH